MGRNAEEREGNQVAAGGIWVMPLRGSDAYKRVILGASYFTSVSLSFVIYKMGTVKHLLHKLA